MNDTATPIDPAASGWSTRSAGDFAGLVGPLWARREEDRWAYGILTGARHANPAGLVHGGLLTTLLDHALSAIAWQDAGRRPCVTVALDTQFVGAVRPGAFVEARGRVVRRTGSMSFVQGSLFVGDDEVATASAVMRILGEA